jgi:HD-GYP domain-containing protein (c-di-GMP phosphodiesterase class II)
MTVRERRASLAFAGSFVAVAAVLPVLFPWHRSPSALTVALLLGAYAVASRIDFEVGAGSAVPTELVLVPMLFLLPASAVPAAVAGGLLLGGGVDHVRRRLHPERALALLSSCWHAVGPALVFLLAGDPEPRARDWPLYLGALAAQFVFEFVSSAGRDRLAHGVRPATSLRFLCWVFLVDLLLAPVSLALVLVAIPHGFLLALPLMGLLRLFARERRARIDHALELSNAYRGTAFLLGDVIEADDAYTGSHSRGVVELVLQVADRLGLESPARRSLEFTALLHDVGKITIPAEIINKPGPLSAEEREVVQRHTIHGQRLLEQVGGVLGEVGRLVRSCHEHVDGSGYPDGLAGEEIPLEARIVSVCDAFSAMTTHRPYRAAMGVDAALAELRRCAGSQFDPLVVDALVDVVETSAALQAELALRTLPALAAAV